MLWERIQALKGKTLHTGRRRKVFEVVDVTDDHAFFVPQDGNGTTRSFPRRGFEHVAGLGSNPGRAHLNPFRPDLLSSAYQQC